MPEIINKTPTVILSLKPSQYHRQKHVELEF